MKTFSSRFIAAVVAGGLLALCLGLNPFWPALWIAPVPLLLSVFAASQREAWLLAMVAGIIGLSGQFRYLTEVSSLAAAPAIILAAAVPWAVATILARHALLRLRHWTVVFAFPLAWSGLDAIAGAVSPYATVGSLANTQMEALLVVQIASVAGTAGIVFVVTLFPSLAAIAIYRGRSISRPLMAYGTGGAVLAVALGYGAWRLVEKNSSAPTVPIGLVVIDTPGTLNSATAADPIWTAYEQAISGLTARGARIVLLPEKIVAIEGGIAMTALAERLGRMAREARVYLAVGVSEKGLPYKLNSAWVFDPRGELVGRYAKQFLLPGGERSFSPGKKDLVIAMDGTRVGVAICKDMDSAALGRRYGKTGAQIMLVPGLDFDRDGWFHSRSGLMRGIENGYAVARAARRGVLVVIDDRGRVLGEASSDVAPGATLLAAVPARADAPTLYTSGGYLFGWICVCLTGLQWVLIRKSEGRDAKGVR